MPPVWDHRADKDLLLTIIESGSLNHIDWPATSAALKAKEYTFSPEACRQHYQKIRKEARGAGPSLPAANSSTPTKARKTKATPKTTPNNTDGFSAGLSDDEGDDAEDMKPTPRKRARTVKPEKPKKREDHEDEDELGGMAPVDLGGYAGQTGVQFKLEEGDGKVDLDDDEIYI